MKKLTVLAVVAILALSGCASNMGGNTYKRAQAQGMQKVMFGVVESTREVTIEGVTGAGVSAGAGAGAVIGSNAGQGRGSLIGMIAGAVIGGVIGHLADRAANTKDALEITVKLDNGDLVAITQSVDGSDSVAPGERVRVVVDQANTSRVQRL